MTHAPIGFFQQPWKVVTFPSMRTMNVQRTADYEHCQFAFYRKSECLTQIFDASARSLLQEKRNIHIKRLSPRNFTSSEVQQGWRCADCTRLPPTCSGLDSEHVAIRGLSLLLVLYSAPRSFSPASSVFPLPKNQHFLIPIRWDAGPTSKSL